MMQHRQWELKPCANLMYDSLTASSYDEIVCVVLTEWERAVAIEPSAVRREASAVVLHAASDNNMASPASII